MTFDFIRPAAILSLGFAAALAAGCQSTAQTRTSTTGGPASMGAAGSTAGPSTTTESGTKGTATAPAGSSAPATGGGAGSPGAPAGGGAAPTR